MKNLISICALFFFAFISAQSVSDYKYLIVPQNFKDFKPNQYGLNSQLTDHLKKLNYTIFEDDTTIENLNIDGCHAVFMDLHNTSSMFKNKVTVVIKDCHQNVIAKYEGASIIKDFEAGYQDALSNALIKFPAQNPQSQLANYKPADQNIVESSKEQDINNTRSSTLKSELKSKANQELSYVNGNNLFKQIFTAPGEFIFVLNGDSMAFAIFSETSKKGVFRVQLKNNVQTIGYEDGNNIVIEIPQNGGGYKPELFQRR